MRVNIFAKISDLAVRLPRTEVKATGRYLLWLNDRSDGTQLTCWTTSAELRQFAFEVLQAADRLADIERQALMDEIPQAVVDDVTAQLEARATAWIPTARVVPDGDGVAS